MEEVNFELESLPFSQPETQKKQIWTASCTVSGRRVIHFRWVGRIGRLYAWAARTSIRSYPCYSIITRLTTSRESGGTAGLIVPHPPHTPSGTVGTAQCTDETSAAAPYPNNTSWSLWQHG